MSFSFKFEDKYGTESVSTPESLTIVDKEAFPFKEVIFVPTQSLELAMEKKIPYLFIYRCLGPKEKAEDGVEDILDAEFNPFFAWLTSASRYLDAMMEVYVDEVDHYDPENLHRVSMDVMDRILPSNPWKDFREYFHYGSGELLPVTDHTIEAMKQHRLFHDLTVSELYNI